MIVGVLALHSASAILVLYLTTHVCAATRIHPSLPQPPPPSPPCTHTTSPCMHPVQVSFGVHDNEEAAARQYDRGLIVEKGSAAKTNFPLREYVAEVRRFEAFLQATCGCLDGPATEEVKRTYTLPLHPKHPHEPAEGAEADKPSRSARAAVVYAEALRQALMEQR